MTSYPRMNLTDILNPYLQGLGGENAVNNFSQEIRHEIYADISAEQSSVSSSSQIILNPISCDRDFPNDDLPTAYPAGLQSHYELQEEMFQAQCQKLPVGTTLQDLDDTIKAFLEMNGKHPNDEPFLCHLPHEGVTNLGKPFPTRIDFHVHMLFFHFNEIANHLGNLNPTQTCPLLEERSPVSQANHQIFQVECMLSISSGFTTSNHYFCRICPRKFPVKYYCRVLRHVIMVHTFQTLKKLLSPEATEKDLKVMICKEVNKAKIIRCGSISKLQCPHCTAQFRQKCSVKYHILRVHINKILSAMNTSCSHIHTIRRPLRTRKYLCTFCPKSFILHQSLQLHKELFHTFLHLKARLPPNSRKNEMNFALEKLLHASLFQEGRKFGCSQCRLRYRQKNSLKVHILQKHLDLICWEIEKKRNLWLLADTPL